jgi:hypothetical protein
MANSTPAKSSPLLIAVAWAIVVLPTAWGFRYTLQNALKIFAAPTATSNPASPAKP